MSISLVRGGAYLTFVLGLFLSITLLRLCSKKENNIDSAQKPLFKSSATTKSDSLPRYWEK